MVILRKDDKLATVVYLFPRSVEIGKRDGNITFAAQIGRLFVTHVFFSQNMLVQDQIEL